MAQKTAGLTFPSAMVLPFGGRLGLTIALALAATLASAELEAATKVPQKCQQCRSIGFCKSIGMYPEMSAVYLAEEAKAQAAPEPRLPKELIELLDSIFGVKSSKPEATKPSYPTRTEAADKKPLYVLSNVKAQRSRSTGNLRLVGDVHNDPRLNEGTEIATHEIIAVDLVGKLFETETARYGIIGPMPFLG